MSTKLSVEMLNEISQVLFLSPDGHPNPCKISYSDIEDSILDFEGDLVDKNTVFE